VRTDAAIPNSAVDDLLSATQRLPADLARLQSIGLGDMDFVRDLIDAFVKSAAEYRRSCHRRPTTSAATPLPARRIS